jgi:hypothetical protein
VTVLDSPTTLHERAVSIRSTGITKKEPARLKRLQDEAAIPEEEKSFWAQYWAAVDEGQPSKAEIRALLKTRGDMDIWPEVKSISSAHQSWIVSELRG